MNRKVYVIFGVISILIAVFFFTLVTSTNHNHKQSTDNNDNHSTLNKNYSKKQIKMANKRSDLEVDLDQKIQSYITDTEAPKDQQTYDEAIKMRSSDEQKHLKRNVKVLIKQKREIKDLNTDTSFKNKDEVEGTYDYTLTYEENGKTQTEDKDGEFTLATNKDGYFYLKTFN